jgi:hypothetical protein
MKERQRQRYREREKKERRKEATERIGKRIAQMSNKENSPRIWP